MTTQIPRFEGETTTAGALQVRESERITRKTRIDTRLRARSWKIVEHSASLDVGTLGAHAVTELPTASGPADYALIVDGQLIGILEAKRFGVDPENVLSQAERYARGLPAGGFERDGLRAPLLWSTNGNEIHFRDVRHALSGAREVRAFLTPDAIRIGLTATPAAHTLAYFKEKIYEYGYRRAVADGFLVDDDAVKIESGVRINGVFLPENEAVQYIDPQTGEKSLDRLEAERQFDASAVERDITVPDSNRKIIEELKRYADEHERRHGRFPKTLIFAVNDQPFTSHAQDLVKTCREVFGRGDDFVAKITGTFDRPLQRIREFRNRPNPGIVVSVDLMSTGVDIPDLEFIFFLRPVKSRILFEQMLGRGTRRGFHFPDKSHFTVFDCFAGTLLEYFRTAIAFAADAPTKAGKTIPELIDDIWNNRGRDYVTRVLVKRLQRIDKEMSGEARELFAAYIPEGDVGQFARSLPRTLRDGFTTTMSILRDPAFQDLLLNYPRAPRAFIVVEEHEDNVTSEWLIRDGLGNEHRPEDYLAAFERFVKENPSRIAAIEILLTRPKDWSTDALEELRQKLGATSERFTIENLQRAHQVQYRRALVDVVSMVKHAADVQQPLLTAAERVERAVGQLSDLLSAPLPPAQQQWFDRIKAHLMESLSIDRDDFDVIPILANHGGWGAANRAFDGQLERVIQGLNEAIAA